MPSCRRPPADEVGGAGVLRHVERVLVAHVDDRGADLDALGARADRRRAAGTASRAGGRSDARGNRRRRRRAPRRRPQARWIAAARRTPSALAIAATESNGRRRGSRCFSCAPNVRAVRRIATTAAPSAPASAGAERGGVLATRQRPGLMPGEARIGETHLRSSAFTFCFSLPSQKKKGGGTPANAGHHRRILRCGTHPAGRARLSAFHHGSHLRELFHPKGSASGQASWDAV